MRILLISPHPQFGGASTANQNIAKSLEFAGHQVIYMDEYFPKDLNNKINLEVDLYPIHKNGIKRQIQTYKYLKSLRPDVVIFGIPIIGVYNWVSLILFRIKGVKIGCIFHSLNLSNTLKGRFIDLLISCFTIVCTHLFFVSNYTLISWKKYLFIKVRKNDSFIIHNVVDKKDNVDFILNKNKIRIGFVGRFSEEKQPDIFCKVAKSYNNSGISFIAFGDGPLLNSCRTKYAEYVDFRGYCSNQEEIYHSVDMLLLTSKFENCPMIILEAALYGIPSIAPNVGGIPEIIRKGENGELYDNFKVSKIKEKIDMIINNYSSYSRNASNFIKSYTIEAMAEKWNNALNK